MKALAIQPQSQASVHIMDSDAQVALRLELQERQRRVHDLLNTLWLQKQQLLWQLEGELQAS
jgi:hypothetical protein